MSNVWVGDLKMFVLLPRKGVYPREYMDNLETFKETFYQTLKIFIAIQILNVFLVCTIKTQIYVWNISNMKNIVDCYKLHVLSDTFV